MMPYDNSKHILFVIGSFTMGGIQSNIAKILSGLTYENIRVSVFVITDKIDESFNSYLKETNLFLLKDICNVGFLSNLNSSAILHSMNVCEESVRIKLREVTHIHAVCSESMIMGCKLSTILDCYFSVGCYHPREFTWEAGGFYFRSIQKEMYSNLPNENKMFFNEETFLSTSDSYQLNKGSIIPLVVDMAKKTNYNVSSKKIVSVGRLVSFKSYTQHMISIIDKINNCYDLELEYHIYGDGTDREYLEALARKSKSKIVFHGILPYSEFEDVLEDAMLFVGCGSALLEAAASGTPSMYGVDSIKEPYTYGYFHEVPGNNLGEVDDQLALMSYEEFFERFFGDVSDNRIQNIIDQGVVKSSSNSLSSVLVKWDNFFDSNVKVSSTFSKVGFRYFTSNLVWLILNVIGIRKDRKARY